MVARARRGPNPPAPSPYPRKHKPGQQGQSFAGGQECLRSKASVATPSQSKTAAPLLESQDQPKTPAAKAVENPAPSPLSAKSTPVKSLEVKKLRPSSVSSESLSSSLPSLPSFTESESSDPHKNLDSQTTMAMSEYLANLKLNPGLPFVPDV